ncbi:hypothetical protein T484DRAFT_1764737 [Baffinella frigidus]|nr:hypothetical protein T484DRAFT_1764737 [Cryptophyta sp. CCMP2293]
MGRLRAVSFLLAALFTCALSPNPAPFSSPLQSHGACRPGILQACGCGSAPACLRSLRGGGPALSTNTSSAASGRAPGGNEALNALRRDAAALRHMEEKAAAALRLMEEKAGHGKPGTRGSASRAASSAATFSTRIPAAKASGAAHPIPTKPKDALDPPPPPLPHVQPPAGSALRAPVPAVRPKIAPPPPPVVSVPRATIKIPRQGATAAGRGGGSWVERFGRLYSEAVRRTVRFFARATGLIQVRVIQWAMTAGIPPWLQQALRLAFEVWSIVLEALEQALRLAFEVWSIVLEALEGVMALPDDSNEVSSHLSP